MFLFQRFMLFEQCTYLLFEMLLTFFNKKHPEQCKKCTKTNKRYDGIIWDNSVGCSGCPLAQPELYRGELF